MSLVFGIDAAWTEKGTSGIALLECNGNQRRIISVSSSYSGFIGKASSPTHPSNFCQPCVGDLLKATGADSNIDVVAIDMPMAHTDITKRREADQAVSRKFGSYGAGVHSPNSKRPGALGKRITEEFQLAGFNLATASLPLPPAPYLIEVFPLAALVRLMGERPKYKTGKTKRYWPNRSVEERISLLLDTWHQIFDVLRGEFSEFGFKIPDCSSVKTLSELKPYEDMLDAVISAWVGSLFLQGRAEPYGDDSSAIWVPCV